MTRYDDAQRFACSDDVLSRVLDGEAVILDLASGQYFGMNEVGSFIWEQLSTQPEVSVGELSRAIVERFEVDASTARADLDGLLGELVERGLLLPAEPT